VIKILILSVLLYYLFRVIARFLTFPARMNHEGENPRVFVYRNGNPNPQGPRKEKDISEKGKVIGD